MENLLYLLAACLLIIGLKMLGSPRTAVRGNAIGAVGMLIAAGVALVCLALPRSIWPGIRTWWTTD